MNKQNNIKPNYKQTKIGLIPKEWEVKQLGDIGKIRMCKRIFNHETNTVGDVPFFKIGTFGKEPNAFITKELYEDYKRRFSHPKKGDILISAAGTLGRTVVYDGTPSYFQDSNIVWIDNDESIVTNEYLFFVYQIVRYESEGGTIQRLYNKIISEAKFRWPPLPEQRKIAKILSTWDRGIMNLESLIKNSQLRKKGLMQKLLSGEQRLLSETGKRFSKEWKTVKLGDCLKIKHGKNQKKVLDKKGKYPILGTGGRFGTSNSFLYDKPSVLIGRKGTIDKPQFIDTPFWTVDTLFYSEIFENTLPKWMFFKFQTINWKKYNEASGVPSLSSSTISSIKINFPPLPEQKRIAEVLSAADQEIELLQKQLAQMQTQKKGLMQVLLTGEKRVLIEN